jgi:BioD-like phosphotransacetylase family protein
MATLLIVSPARGSGKSTIVAGLAGKLGASGAHSLEAPPDDLAQALSEQPGARAIVVATPATSPADLAAYIGSNSIAGVILNRVPAKRTVPIRAAYEAAGVKLLGIVPEDRLLAAPSIGQVAEALGGDSEQLDGNSDRLLERVVIASIAADPGQSYFDRTKANAIIVRSDKPDLQLAALNTGPICLIVTGGLPVLSYVLERVADEEIPLVRTKLDTTQAVGAIEGLFGSRPFSGSLDKLRRIEELLAGVDVDALVQPRAAG